MRLTTEVYLVGDGDRGLSHHLDCCIYLVDCGSAYVMIDSGAGLETDQVLSNVKTDGVDLNRVKYLLVTHSHADHACGASYFQANVDLEVCAPDREANFMDKGSDEELGLDVARGSIYPDDFKYIHCKPDIVLVDSEQLKVGNKTFKLIQVPGHSPGIGCILVNDHVLFSSDVVFHGGTVGLGNWLGCDLTEYRKNIGKLHDLRVRELFPGHFLFTLRDGQTHLEKATKNLNGPWVPPAWQHNHPLY